MATDFLWQIGWCDLKTGYLSVWWVYNRHILKFPCSPLYTFKSRKGKCLSFSHSRVNWLNYLSRQYKSILPIWDYPLIQCEKKDHLKWTYNARNFWTKTVGFLFCLSKSSKIWNCLQWSFCYTINPLLTAVYSYGDTLSLTTFFIHQSGV